MAAFTLTQSLEDPSVFLVLAPDGMPVLAINEFLLHLSHCGRSAYTLRSYAHGYNGPKNVDRERVRKKIDSSMMRKQYTSAFKAKVVQELL